MNIYLVTCAQGLTDSYHSGGSMLVAAESESDALAVFHENRREKPEKEADDEIQIKQIVVAGRGKLAVMRDAGCC